jgi:hypothetical protein
MPPGTNGPPAIETTTGDVLACLPVAHVSHDIVTIKSLDEGPTGGDV